MAFLTQVSLPLIIASVISIKGLVSGTNTNNTATNITDVASDFVDSFSNTTTTTTTTNITTTTTTTTEPPFQWQLCEDWFNKSLPQEPVYSCENTGPLLANYLEFLNSGFMNVNCKNPESVRQASVGLYCSFAKSYSQCETKTSQQVPGADGSRQVLPVPSFRSNENTVKILCNENQSIDWPCLKRFVGKIHLCVEGDVKAYNRMRGRSGTYADVDICRLVTMTTLCAFEGLEECGKDTFGPIVTILSQQLSPQIMECERSSAPSLHGHMLFLVVTVLSILFLSVDL